jgi:hypothetical protein
VITDSSSSAADVLSDALLAYECSSHVIGVAAESYEHSKRFGCHPGVFDCPDWYDSKRSQVFGFELLWPHQ